MSDKGKEKPEKPELRMEKPNDTTILAYDRTIMAWVRTSVSLISFGFTIYKLFEINQQRATNYLISAREFAIAMQIVGVFSMATSTFQYLRFRSLARKVRPELPRSMAAVTAILVSLLGILGLIATLARV